MTSNVDAPKLKSAIKYWLKRQSHLHNLDLRSHAWTDQINTINLTLLQRLTTNFSLFQVILPHSSVLELDTHVTMTSIPVLIGLFRNYSTNIHRAKISSFNDTLFQLKEIEFDYLLNFHNFFTDSTIVLEFVQAPAITCPE
ncbi:hypothetical protein FRB97_003138 [Tulasnella sp. 331]|nr:hypothetical protein FRB97_003138 [Tulasnella sp. 331]